MCLFSGCEYAGDYKVTRLDNVVYVGLCIDHKNMIMHTWPDSLVERIN